MGLKFNIASIDLKKLDENIELYWGSNGKTQPKYIIMSEDTESLMREPLNGYITGNYSTYMGIPIAICDKLTVGEIELV